MVKAPHEALHRIFQHDPFLFSRALLRAGVVFPETSSVSVISPDLTETKPVERRADTVLMADTPVGKHVIIIEAQTEPEESKLHAWPYYVAYLHNLHRCPVTLLVVTMGQKTADWARRPIPVGLPGRPSQVTQPLVLGPDNMPWIISADEAQDDPVAAVLSVLMHRLDDGVDAILKALAAALDRVDLPTAKCLAEFTEVGLGDSRAADIWRAMMGTMTYGFESQLHREWRAEGRVEQAAAAVLRVLEVRGLAVPEDVARRVQECTDQALLDDLLTRAVTIDSAEELFTD